MITTRQDEKQIRELQREIVTIMRQIRADTPHALVSPDEAKGSEVWEGNLRGEPIKRVIVYLRSSGCTWAIRVSGQERRFLAGCLDCQHSVAGTTQGVAISSASYVKQFLHEYKKYDFREYPVLCVYNEGSFFNERELPMEARREIMRIIGSDTNIKGVILESLPEFITEEAVRETRQVLGDKHVEIGIGLESSSPIVRGLCINKPFSLEEFENSAGLVNRYFDLLAYVLVKPSFLTEAEALADAVASARYAFSVGAKVVSLEPVSIGDHVMSGALHRLGLYRSVWLWTVIEIVKSVHELGEVRVGGVQFSPKYEYSAFNCDDCTHDIHAAISSFNSTYEIRDLLGLDCHCKSEWRDELARDYPSLLDRLPSTLKKLRSLYQPASHSHTIAEGQLSSTFAVSQPQ